MSEDLTNKLPTNQNQTLSRVLDVVQELSVRVEKLDRKVEERFYDTRSMWQHLAGKVDQLQEGLEQLREGFEQLRQGFEQLRQGQHDLRQEARGLKLICATSCGG